MDTNSRQNWSTQTPATEQQGKHARATASTTARATARQAARPMGQEPPSAPSLDQNVAFGTADKPEGFVQTWKKATHTWRFRAVLCVFLALLLVMMQPTGNALYRSWNAATGEAQGLGAAFANGDGEEDDTLNANDTPQSSGKNANLVAATIDLSTAEVDTDLITAATPAPYLDLGVNDLLVFYGDVNDTTAPVITRYVQDGEKNVTYTADGSPQTGVVATATSAKDPSGQDYLPVQGTDAETTLSPWTEDSASQGNYGAISSVVQSTGGWSVPKEYADSPSNFRVKYDVVKGNVKTGDNLPSPLWSLGYTHDAWWYVDTSYLGPLAAQGYIFMPEKVGQSNLTLTDAVQAIYYPTGVNVYTQAASVVLASGVDESGNLKSPAYTNTTTKTGGTYYDKWYYASWKPTRYTVQAWYGGSGSAKRVWSSYTDGGATQGLLWSDPLDILPSSTENGLLISSDITWVPVTVAGSSGSASLAASSYTGGVKGGYAPSGGDAATKTTGYKAYELFNPNSLTSAVTDPAYRGTTVEDTSRADLGATLVNVAPAFTVTFHGDNGGTVTGSGAKSMPFLISSGSSLNDAYNTDVTFEPSSSVIILPFDATGEYSQYCGVDFAKYASSLEIPSTGTATTNYWKKNKWTSVHFVDVNAFEAAAISKDLTTSDGFQNWLTNYLNYERDGEGAYWDLDGGNGKFKAKTNLSLTAEGLDSSSASAYAGTISTPASSDSDFSSYFSVNSGLELKGWNQNAGRAAGESAGTMTGNGSTIDAGDTLEIGTLLGSTDLYAVWGSASDVTITWAAGTDSEHENAPTATVSGSTTTITPGTVLTDSNLPTITPAAGYGGSPTWTKTVDGTTTPITSPVGETVSKDTTFTVTYTKLDSRTVTFETSNPSIGQVGLYVAANGETPASTTALASTSVLDGTTWSDLKGGLNGTLVLIPATAQDSDNPSTSDVDESSQDSINAAFYAKYGHNPTIQSWNLGTSSGTEITNNTAFSADTTVVATPTPVYNITLNIGGYTDAGVAGGDNLSGTFATAYGTTPVVIAEVPYGTSYANIYVDPNAATTAYMKDGTFVESGTEGAVEIKKLTYSDDTSKTSFADLVGSGTNGVLGSGATGTLGKYGPTALANDMNNNTAATTWTTGAWDNDSNAETAFDITSLTGTTPATVAGNVTYTYTFDKGLVPVLFSKKPLEAAGYAKAQETDNTKPRYKDLSDSTLGEFTFDMGTGIINGGTQAPSSSAVTVAGVEFAAPSNVEAVYVPWGTSSNVFTTYSSSHTGTIDSSGFPKIVTTGSADESTWRDKYSVSGSVNYTTATWAYSETLSGATNSTLTNALPTNFTDDIYVYEGTAPLASYHVKVLVKDATDQATTAGWLLDATGTKKTGTDADRLVVYNNPGTSDGNGNYTFTEAATQTLTWGDYASTLLTNDILQGPNDEGKFQYTQADEAKGWNDESTRAWLTTYDSNNVNPATTQVTTDDQTFYVTVGKKATTNVDVTVNGGTVNGETAYTITNVPVGTKLSDIVYTKTTENGSSTYTFYSTDASDIAASTTSGSVTTERKQIEGTQTPSAGYTSTDAAWATALANITTVSSSAATATFTFLPEKKNVTISFEKPSSTDLNPSYEAATGAYLNAADQTNVNDGSFTVYDVPVYVEKSGAMSPTTLEDVKYAWNSSTSRFEYDANGTAVPAVPVGVPDGLATSGTGWMHSSVAASTASNVFGAVGDDGVYTSSPSDSTFTYRFALIVYTVNFVIEHGTWATTLSDGSLSENNTKFTVNGLKSGDTLSGGAATIAAIGNNTEMNGNNVIVAAAGWGKNAGETSQKVKGMWDTTPATTISGNTTDITYTFTPTQVDTITWQVQNGYFTSVAGDSYAQANNKTSATEQVYRGDSMQSVAVANKDATVYSGPTWYTGSVADANKVGDGTTAPSGTTNGDVAYIADFAKQQVTWQIVPHYQKVDAAKNNSADETKTENWDTGTALDITTSAGDKLTANSNVTPSGKSEMTLEAAITSLLQDGFSYADFNDNPGRGEQTIAAYLETTGFTPTTNNTTLDVYFLRNKYALTLQYTFDGDNSPGTGFNPTDDGFAPTWVEPKESPDSDVSHPWTSPSGNSETFNDVVFGEKVQVLSGNGRMVTFTPPTNNEYDFKWLDSSSAEVTDVAALTMPAANTTYTGAWTRKNTYTVTFYNTNSKKGTIDGETNSSMSGAEKEVVVTGKWHDQLTAPTVTGKTYDGKNWSNMFWTSTNGAETAATVPNTIATNAVYWTHYGTNTAVTYANDGSAGVNTTAWNAIDSSKLTFEGTPNRPSANADKFGGSDGLDPATYANTGYVFDKWTVSPALSAANQEKFDEKGGTKRNQPMQDGFSIDQNYTFTATYKKDTFNITYQQTLKSVGGDQTSSLTNTPATFSKSTSGSLTLPVLATTVDHYQFSKYEITYTGANGTETLEDSKVTNYSSASNAPSVAISDLPEADITVTAVYEPVNYTVTFQFAKVSSESDSRSYTNASDSTLNLTVSATGAEKGVSVADGGQTATVSVPYGTQLGEVAQWVTILTDAKYEGIGWSDISGTVEGTATLDGTPQIKSYTVTVAMATSPAATGTLSAGDKTNQTSIDFTATYGQQVGNAQYKYSDGSGTNSALVNGGLTINPSENYNASEYLVTRTGGTGAAPTQSTWTAETVTGAVTYTLELAPKRYQVVFNLVSGDTTYTDLSWNSKSVSSSGIENGDAQLAFDKQFRDTSVETFVTSGSTITLPTLVATGGVDVSSKYEPLTWITNTESTQGSGADTHTQLANSSSVTANDSIAVLAAGTVDGKATVGTITLTAFTTLKQHGVTITAGTGASMKSGTTNPVQVGYGQNVYNAIINATQPQVGYAQDATEAVVTIEGVDAASVKTTTMGTNDLTASISYPKLHKVTLEMPKGTFTAETSTAKYANNNDGLTSGRDKENTSTYIELYVADGKTLDQYYTLYKWAGLGNLVKGSNTFVTPVSSGVPTGYKGTGRWQTTSTWAEGNAISGELKDQTITADTTFYYVYEPTADNTATVNVFYQNKNTPASGVAGTAADYYNNPDETQPVADQTFQLTGLTFDANVNVAGLLTEVGTYDTYTNAGEGDTTAISAANAAQKIMVPVGFKKELADHGASGVQSTSTYTVNAKTGTINVYLDRETLDYTYSFLSYTNDSGQAVTPPSAADAKDGDGNAIPTAAKKARYGETVTLWSTDTAYNGTVDGVASNLSFLGWVKGSSYSSSDTPFGSYTFDSSNVTYNNGTYTPATTAFGGVWGTKVYKTTVRLLSDAELSVLGSTTLPNTRAFDASEYDKAAKLAAGGKTTAGDQSSSVEVKTAANTAIAEPTHEFSVYNPNYSEKSDDHAKYEIVGWVAKHKATSEEADATSGVTVGDLVWDRDANGNIQIYTATNGALGVTAKEDGQEIMPLIQVKRYTVTFTGGAHGSDPMIKTDTTTVGDVEYQYGTQFTLKYGDALPYSPVFDSAAKLQENVIAEGSGTTVTDSYGFDSNGYVPAKSTEEARAWKTPQGVGTGTGTRSNWEIVGDSNVKNIVGTDNAAVSGTVSYDGTPNSSYFVGGDIDISWKWEEKTYKVIFKNVNGSSMQKLEGKEWTGDSGVTDVSTTIGYTESIFKNLLVSQYAVGPDHASSSASVLMSNGTTQAVTITAYTDDTSKTMQLPSGVTALFDGTYSPSKANATFQGWVAGTASSQQQATPIKGRDVTVKDLYSASFGGTSTDQTTLYVYATWQGFPSRIVFKTNFDGSANSANNMSGLTAGEYTYTDAVVDEQAPLPAVSTMPAAFAPAGYEFDHWATTAAGGTPTYNDRADFTPTAAYDSTNNTGGHELFAVYKPHTYQVRWLKLDGNTYVTNKEVYEKYQSALNGGTVTGTEDAGYSATYTVANNTQGLEGISKLVFIGTTNNPVNEDTPYTQVFTYNQGSAFPEMGSLTGETNTTKFRAWFYGNITINKGTFTGAGLIADGATLTTLTTDSYTGNKYIVLKAQPKSLVTLTLNDNNQKTGSTGTYTIDLDEDLTEDAYTIVRNTPTKDGYDFAGWQIGNDVYYSTKDAAGDDNTTNLPDGAKTAIPKSVLQDGASGVGQWTTGSASYTVKYYFEQTPGKKDWWSFEETGTGQTGETASVSSSLDSNGALTNAASKAATDGKVLRAASSYAYAATSSTRSDTIQADGSTTLELFYTLQSYTATFKYYGQSFSPNPQKIQVVRGDSLTLPRPGDGVMDAIPAGTGLNANTYWIIGGTHTVNCGDSYTMTGNTTFNMVLLPDTHYVTFALGDNAKWSDGTTDTVRTVTDVAEGSGVGDKLPAVEGTQATGYAFIGWTLSTRESEEANWTATTNVYTNDEVKAYAINDDNVKFTASYLPINTITYSPGGHSANGFGGATATFDSIDNGWTYTVNGAKRIEGGNEVTADVRLGAMDATALATSYSTSFDESGNPKAETGYAFKEWVDETGAAYATLAVLYTSAPTSGSHTFTATYEPTVQTLTFTATPNSDNKPGPKSSSSSTVKGKTATNINDATGATAVAPAGPEAASGYEFDYWQKDGGTAADRLQGGAEITFPASDATYTAVYKPIEVDIDFTTADADQGKVTDTAAMPGSVTVPAAGYDSDGTAISAPQNKALPKLGYHFKAWTPSTAIAGFSGDGTWYNASASIMSGSSPNPAYGLLTVQKVDGVYTANTYTASFERAQYTASFQTEDPNKGAIEVTTTLGTSVSPAQQTLYYGDKVSYRLVDKAQTGYEFKGWTYVMQEEYIDASGNLAIREVKQETPISTDDVKNTPIKGDTMFTAVFDKQQVQLRFDSNSGGKASGSAVAAITGESGQTGITLPSCTWEWAGHEFKGWSTTQYDKYDAGASPAQVIVQPGTAVSMPDEGAVTYFAVWEVHEVTVVYHNSASPLSDTSATGASKWYQDNKDSDNEDIKTYRFVSIPRDVPKTAVASTETPAESPADVFAEDVTSDNTWGAPGYISPYAGELKIPGYAREFLGWTDTPGGQVLITPENLVIPASMMPTGETNKAADTTLNLYAVWGDKTYTIKLNPGTAGSLKNGVTTDNLVIGDTTKDPTTATITYGTTVEIPAAATKFEYDSSEEEGYNYKGWSDNASPQPVWTKESPSGTAFNDNSSYVFRSSRDVTLTAEWAANNTANAKLAVAFNNINPSESLPPTPYQGLMKKDKPLADGKHDVDDPAYTLGGWYVARPVSNTIDLGDDMDKYKVDEDATLGDILLKYYSEEGTPGRVSLKGTLNYATNEAPAYVKADGSFTDAYYTAANNDYVTIPLYRYKAIEQYTVKYLTKDFAPGEETGKNDTMAEQTAKVGDWATTSLASSEYAYDGYEFVGWVKALPTRTYDANNGKYDTTWALPSGFSVIQNDLTFDANGVATVGSGTNAVKVFAAGYTLKDKRDLLTETESNQNISEVHLVAVWKAVPTNAVTYVLAYDGDGAADPENNGDCVFDSINTGLTWNNGDQVGRVGTLVYPGAKIDNTTYGTAPAPDTSEYPVDGYSTFTFMGWNTKADGTGVWLDSTDASHLNLPYTQPTGSSSDLGDCATVKQVVEAMRAAGEQPEAILDSQDKPTGAYKLTLYAQWSNEGRIVEYYGPEVKLKKGDTGVEDADADYAVDGDQKVEILKGHQKVKPDTTIDTTGLGNSDPVVGRISVNDLVVKGQKPDGWTILNSDVKVSQELSGGQLVTKVAEAQFLGGKGWVSKLRADFIDRTYNVTFKNDTIANVDGHAAPTITANATNTGITWTDALYASDATDPEAEGYEFGGYTVTTPVQGKVLPIAKGATVKTTAEAMLSNDDTSLSPDAVAEQADDVYGTNDAAGSATQPKQYTLSAVWTPKTYTLTFNSGVADFKTGGKTATATGTWYDDGILFDEEDMLHAGYKDVKWYFDLDGDGVKDADDKLAWSDASKDPTVGDLAAAYKAAYSTEAETKTMGQTVNLVAEWAETTVPIVFTVSHTTRGQVKYNGTTANQFSFDVGTNTGNVIEGNTTAPITSKKVTAVADDGYLVDGWYLNGQKVVSGDTIDLSKVTVDDDTIGLKGPNGNGSYVEAEYEARLVGDPATTVGVTFHFQGTEKNSWPSTAVTNDSSAPATLEASGGEVKLTGIAASDFDSKTDEAISRVKLYSTAVAKLAFTVSGDNPALKGFTYDDARTGDLTVTADGKAVGHLYFKRSAADLHFKTYVEGGGAATPRAPETRENVLYQHVETLPMADDAPTAPAGYHFDGWYVADTQDKPTGSAITSFTMTLEDATIVGKYVPESVTATMLGVYTVKDDGTVGNKITEASLASINPTTGTKVENIPYGSTLFDKKYYVELKPATGASDKRGYQGTGEQTLGAISYADTQYITWVYTVEGDSATYTTNDPTRVELKGNTTFYAVSSPAAVVIYTPGDHGAFTASLDGKTRYEGINVKDKSGNYANPYALRDYPFKGDDTAEPEGEVGWKFAGWHVRYIGSDHETIIDSTGSDPYSTTALYNEFDKLYHSITVTAAWEPDSSKLTVDLGVAETPGLVAEWGTTTDAGGNVKTADPSGTYKTGKKIPLPTITATTADPDGWVLEKWVATVDGVDYEYAPGSTFKMPAAASDAETVLRAVWAEKYVTVEYKAADPTMGTVSVGSEQIGVYTGRVKGESAVTAGSTATANENYTFVKWHEGSPTGAEPAGVSGDGATVVPQKADGKYEAATYYAEFSGKEYTVAFSVNPASVNPDTNELLGYIRNAAGDPWTGPMPKVVYGKTVDLDVIDGVPYDGEAYADGKYWTWTMYEGQDTATGTSTTGQVDRAGLAALPIKGYTELVVSFKHPTGEYIVEFQNTEDGKAWTSAFTQRFSWSDSVSTQRAVERIGYDFKGWFVDVPPATKSTDAADYEAKPGSVQLAGQRFSQLAGGDLYDGESNVVLRAGWQMREGYAVNFDAYGGAFAGSSSTTTTVDRTAAGNKIAWSGDGSAVPAPAEPTWAGHEFLGWYTQPVGGERVYVDASGDALTAMNYDAIVEAVNGTTKGHDGVGEHPTLYARWQEKQYTVVYFAKWGDNNEYKYTTTHTFTIDQTGLNISAPSNSDENWRWAGEWRYGSEAVPESADNTAATWAAASGHVIDGSSTIRKIEQDLDSSDTAFTKQTYYAYGSFEGKKYITTEYQLWEPGADAATNPVALGYESGQLQVVDRAWAGDVVVPNVSKEIPGFVFGTSAEAKAKTVELNKAALGLGDGATYDDVKKQVPTDDNVTFQVAYYARGGYTLKFDLNDRWGYGADGLTHAASLVKTDPATHVETTVTDANIDAEMTQTGKTFLTNDNVPYIEFDNNGTAVRIYSQAYDDPVRPGFEFGGWNAVQIDDASHTNEGVTGYAPADPGNSGSDTLYGWLTRNADGSRFDPINNPDSALTLFAKWTELRREVSYIVANDPALEGVLNIKLARNDDSTYGVDALTEVVGAASGDTFDASGARVVADSKIGALAKVVKRGYSFAGWKVVGEEGVEYKEERGEAMGDALVTASAASAGAVGDAGAAGAAGGLETAAAEATDEGAADEGAFAFALFTAAADDDAAAPSYSAADGTQYTTNAHVTAGVNTGDNLFAGAGSEDDDSPLVVYMATAALNDKQQVTYDKGEADKYTGVTRATQPTGTYFGEQPVVANGVEKWGEASEGSLPASSTISREGYTFNGWKANVDLTYDIVDADGNVTGQGVVPAGTVIDPASAIAKHLIVPATAVTFTPDWTRGTQQRLVTVPEATNPDTGEVVPATTIEIEDGGYLTDDQIRDIIKRGDKYPDTWDVTAYVDGQPVTKTMTVDELIKYLQENPVTSDMTIAVNPKAKWSDKAPTIPTRPSMVRPAKDRAAKTGDTLPIAPIAGSAVVAALVLAFLFIIRRRRTD